MTNVADKKAGRGRPRNFDLGEALHKAQTLFHRHGYEGVSLTDLTGAIGITAPSFYAAFKSKAALFEQSLKRYSEYDGIPFVSILRPERDLTEALADLLMEAARRYGADPEARGCLVLAGRTALEADARLAACRMQQTASAAIQAFVAQSRPDAANAVTSYMATIMAGLSAEARSGASPEVLMQTARDAALALPLILGRAPK